MGVIDGGARNNIHYSYVGATQTMAVSLACFASLPFHYLVIRGLHHVLSSRCSAQFMRAEHPSNANSTLKSSLPIPPMHPQPFVMELSILTKIVRFCSCRHSLVRVDIFLANNGQSVGSFFCVVI